jgi:hypothetical protein
LIGQGKTATVAKHVRMNGQGRYRKKPLCDQRKKYEDAARKGMVDALGTTESNAAMGILAWINEDSTDSINYYHPTRWSLSREYQIHGLIHASNCKNWIEVFPSGPGFSNKGGV